MVNSLLKFIGRLSRTLPIFPGKSRLLRILLQRIVKSERDVVVKAKKGIRYLLPNINEALGFSIYINGSYEEKFVDFIADNIPENGIFVDAGANIGCICIPVSKKRPDVKIIAIEASPRVFGYLDHNVKQNRCHNIIVVNKALSDTNDETVEFYSPDGLFGKGSLSPIFTKAGETVSTITVDSLIRQFSFSRIDLMKIDVEGYEKKVFQGMNNLFDDKKVRSILFEFVDWAESNAGCKAGDAQEYLKAKGFDLSIFSESGLASLKGTLSNGSAMLYATN
jgi:FkbM family methyltransferase